MNAHNTVLQTCFFAISGVLPRDQAIAQIKHPSGKTYGGKGEAVVADGISPPSTGRLRSCTRCRCRPR